MVTRGLLVRLDARVGQAKAVEEFLVSALPLVNNEPATTAWFAIRFGRSDYGIFDVFPDDAGLAAHLAGPVAQALMERAEVLFDTPPLIRKLEILAEKLPGATTTVDLVTKGLVLTFRPTSGHEKQVEDFLRSAKPLVQDEPKTTAWFAMRTDEGEYGIFDVFPDNAGRFAHLAGHVPRELAKHALTLLGGFPDMTMIDVLATKLPGASASVTRAAA
jgi:quinol monooxygenase YgiN